MVSFWKRLMAYNIDFLFYLLFAMIFRFIFAQPLEMYLSLAISIFVFEISFLISPWAATPGRRKMNIQVVGKNGQKLPWHRIILRTFAKVGSLAIFFIGFAMIAFRQDKRALHDLIASSLVVYNLR